MTAPASTKPWYRQPLFIVGTIVVAIAFLAYREYSLNNVGKKHAMVGSDAPAFELPLMGGPNTFRLEDHLGKVILLDFWATWCVPCKRMVPALRAINGRYSEDENFMLVPINTDDDEPTRARKVHRYMTTAHLNTIVPFDDTKTQVLYDVRSIPTMVLIGKDGKIARVFRGVTTRSVIERAINQELKR